MVTPGLKDDFLKACEFEPPLGARIYTQYACYGLNYDGLGLWVMYDGNAPIAAVSCLDGRVTVCGHVRTDIDELASFLRLMTSWREMEAAAPLCHMFRDKGRFSTAHIMRYEGKTLELDTQNVRENPPLRDVYQIVCSSDMDFARNADWNAWYPWASHLVRHELGFVCALYHDEKPVSTGGVYAMNERQAVIGGVATLPAWRGNGYGEQVVRYLVNGCLFRGREPALFCATDELAQYYERIGFRQTGTVGKIVTHESQI